MSFIKKVVDHALTQSTSINGDTDKKPRFLTKEERQKLAIERREKEVANQREMHKATIKTTIKNTNSAAHLDEEYKSIRDRFMGVEQEKRKIRKLNEKKFVFDWDKTEDTSADLNPIYKDRHTNQMFGRGNIAGIDIKEQKKKNSYYKELISERQSTEQKERETELKSLIKSKEKRTAWDERNWREKPLEEMLERDWRIFREDFSISTKGGNVPKPIRNWDEAELPMPIKRVIWEVGYKEPTPIQMQGIPIGMQNRDVIGIAETGSGKTCAFLLPMLAFISKMPKLDSSNSGDGPYALILAPTRELAQQIETEALKFARPLGYNCVSLVGGHSMAEQGMQLRNGCEIIIATPGRLKDCIESHVVVLNQCTYLVLDEADRMVEMGFDEDLSFILKSLPVTNQKPDSDEAEIVANMLTSSGLPRYRQTTMFSATMPSSVEKIAQNFLRRPIVVTIGEAGGAVSSVEQRVEMISEERKRDRLLAILAEGWQPPIIIFVNQKKGVDILAKSLDKLGYKSTTLHGGKAQDSREVSLGMLKKGEKDILVATDVASRGIDVPNVSLVINYDMAKNIEDYTHRIGRTGRAGKSGVAITFLTKDNEEVFFDLKNMLIASTKSVCPHELMHHEAAKVKPGTIVQKSRKDEKIFKN